MAISRSSMCCWDIGAGPLACHGYRNTGRWSGRAFFWMPAFWYCWPHAGSAERTTTRLRRWPSPRKNLWFMAM